MWTLSRSPLTVFLLLGIGVFAGERWLVDGNDQRRVVRVTVEQVDALRARWDAQWGRAPTGRELRGLIDEAVREEILYREALRMALDRDDPIVRRRLARKMTFMLEDNSDVQEPAPREVEEFFSDHAERYRQPARTTFQHVFLSHDRREDPERDAAGLLGVLRNEPERSWRTAGDAFALLREYAGRTDREIAESFGADFSAALADLAPGNWRGPVTSAHGTHLVRVLTRSTPRTPALQDVRERVTQDLLEAGRRAQNAAALQTLRERYEVQLPALDAFEGRPRETG